METNDAGKISGRFRVAVRLRPRNEEEEEADASCVELQPEFKRVKLHHREGFSNNFEFHEVFSQFTKQKRVYKRTARPVVKSVLDGDNGVVMAYGQTGTGKTFTLHQLGEGDRSTRGIMVHSMEDILAEISLETDSVSISYLQLCKETIQDLLDYKNDSTQIVEDPKTGDVSLSGATRREIRDLECFMKLLRLGEAHRDAESSQSHAILMVHVHRSVEGSKPALLSENGNGSDLAREQPLVREGKLLVVDLAGSEHAGTGKYNISLGVLKNCINALASNNPYVPYHDSKLTMLLQDLLGGTATAALIVTIGPSPRHIRETENTLLFGQKAMEVASHDKQRRLIEHRFEEMEQTCVEAFEEIRKLEALIEDEKSLRRDVENQVKLVKFLNENKKKSMDSTLFHKIKETVVLIHSVREEKDGTFFTGTGVIINSKGYVLTCAHVFEPPYVVPTIQYYKSEFKRNAGCFVEAEFVKKSVKYDIAILKPVITREFTKWAKFTRKNAVPIGLEVGCANHTDGLHFTYSFGEVSFPCRSIREIRKHDVYRNTENSRNMKLTQINGMNLSGGSSGGAIFDKKGRVIGIEVFAFGMQDFMVHPKIVKSYIKDYVEDCICPKRRRFH